jgi:HPt (histidine-containing phosphotransfer) domain-containing protein
MAPETPEEEFEKLRQHFHQRLRKEQAQLVVLAEALRRANSATAAAVFVDIRSFAHRLRGAALVFGYQAVGEGAKAVELAAIAVSLNLSGRQLDLSVVSTMQALAINLVEEIGPGLPGANAAGPPGESQS